MQELEYAAVVLRAFHIARDETPYVIPCYGSLRSNAREPTASQVEEVLVNYGVCCFHVVSIFTAAKFHYGHTDCRFR